MKCKGFILPLVLTVLFAISLTSMQIFSQQKQHFKEFVTTEKQIKFQNRLLKLKNASIYNTESSWPSVSKTNVPLSGLFNLNSLVSNSVLGDRVINQRERAIFTKILQKCGLPLSYTKGILAFLTSKQKISVNFSTIDLLAFLDIPPNEIPDFLVCFRLSSRFSRVNIKFSSASHIEALLEVSSDEANSIKSRIIGGQISNRSELISYLNKKESVIELKRKHRNIIVSDLLDHAATYWTYNNETFAYFEQTFAAERGWSIFTDTVLWLPELE